MAELTDPRFGLSYGWDLGETEWKTGMDSNLIKLGALWGLSVLNRTLTDPPGAPTEGDMHIVYHIAPTGAWIGHEDEIAYYFGGAWRFYVPSLNWACRIEAESDCVVVWNGTSWDGDIYIAEGSSIHTGTTSGTTIGDSASNLLSLWGATPIVQPANATQAVATPTNTDGDIAALTFSASPTQAECEALRDACEIVADDMRANNVLLTAIRTALTTAGAIKGSA